jgi:hypothetical protein
VLSDGIDAISARVYGWSGRSKRSTVVACFAAEMAEA